MRERAEGNAVCQYLEWDSGFFGRRIGRVIPNRLTEVLLREIRSWCDSQRIECLYFLADSDDAETVKLAEDAFFHLVDVRIILGMDLQGWASPEFIDNSVRSFRAEDLAALRDIARVSHRDSRFYYDPNLPDPLCDALYEVWIKRSTEGYAQAVLVAEVDKQPVGYISCHLASASQIGLFAVAEKAQGRGVGRQLVLAALRWFRDKKASEVTVVTQGRNVGAQRLYQKCGFTTRSVQLWYHYWTQLRTQIGK